MPDLFNGLFELIGACFVWMDVRQLYIDKRVRGVYWPARLFFTAWGVWNLYYYPAIEQMCSFVGGFWLASGNLAWFILFYYYRRLAYANTTK